MAAQSNLEIYDYQTSGRGVDRHKCTRVSYGAKDEIYPARYDAIPSTGAIIQATDVVSYCPEKVICKLRGNIGMFYIPVFQPTLAEQSKEKNVTFVVEDNTPYMRTCVGDAVYLEPLVGFRGETLEAWHYTHVYTYQLITRSFPGDDHMLVMLVPICKRRRSFPGPKRFEGIIRPTLLVDDNRVGTIFSYPIRVAAEKKRAPKEYVLLIRSNERSVIHHMLESETYSRLLDAHFTFKDPNNVGALFYDGFDSLVDASSDQADKRLASHCLKTTMSTLAGKCSINVANDNSLGASLVRHVINDGVNKPDLWMDDNVIKHGGAMTICQPLFHPPAFVTARTSAQAFQTVAIRVVEPKLKAEALAKAMKTNPKQLSEIEAYANEFIDCIADEVDIPMDCYQGNMTPGYNCVDNATRWDIIDYLIATQRPSKKRIYREMMEYSDYRQETDLETFFKAETQKNAGKARIIQSLGPEVNLELQRIYKPVKDRVFARCTWFSPGKKPKSIATQVTGIVQRGKGISEGDFEAMDSGYTEMARKIAVDIVKAFLRDDVSYVAAAEALRTATNNRDGFHFIVEEMTCSGHPHTTLENTIICAFISYVALRKKYPTRDAAYAYGRLGQYSGDDSLNEFLPGLAKTAAQFGFILKSTDLSSVDIVDHKVFPAYLGRVYVDAGRSTSSIQDLGRTLPKFFVCFGQGDKAQRSVNKATGLLVENEKTPILGDICRLMLRSYPSKKYKPELFKEDWWKFNVLMDSMEDGEGGGYPQGDDESSFYELAATSRLNCSVDTLYQAVDRVRCWKHVDDIDTLFGMAAPGMSKVREMLQTDKVPSNITVIYRDMPWAGSRVPISTSVRLYMERAKKYATSFKLPDSLIKN
jgi:hypothetical protein